jgi:nucleotide-binding universal stress UspA family protein
MSGIVCAIRGGPGSQATIANAIDLARESGEPLVFVYVVDLEFLSRTGISRVRTISEEMHQMGEFILLAAQTQAAEQGVTAQGIVRHGNVREEIADLCQEIGATTCVMGRPQTGQESNVFTPDMLEQFGEYAQERVGATVILMDEDEETS